MEGQTSGIIILGSGVRVPPPLPSNHPLTSTHVQVVYENLGKSGFFCVLCLLSSTEVS